ARLTVLGKGSEEASLKQMAKELGVSDSVCFTGSVDNDKVPALYRQSDIFLNTSSVDNMPISVLEAFACGLPVISANTGGLRYMVEDGKTGFLTNFNDHNAMAERVFGLLESQEQAKRISADAREYVKSFSWDNVRGKWAEVYTV
ncbi:MAG: glycosyltransferase family 4 protein, partial [Candidatus Omnitrophota bacterium]|nr:glycosyltransferase family 4 protein [Candidatus Omnitrophota bacterium]